MKLKCNQFCAPFIIYVILSIISLLSTFQTQQTQILIITLTIHIISNLIFGYLIYWLCYHCHLTIAWIVLLLPIILSIILTILFIGFIIKNLEKYKSTH
jgi:hypothetical protein